MRRRTGRCADLSPHSAPASGGNATRPAFSSRPPQRPAPKHTSVRLCSRVRFRKPRASARGCLGRLSVSPAAPYAASLNTAAVCAPARGAAPTPPQCPTRRPRTDVHTATTSLDAAAQSVRHRHNVSDGRKSTPHQRHTGMLDGGDTPCRVAALGGSGHAAVPTALGLLFRLTHRIVQPPSTQTSDFVATLNSGGHATRLAFPSHP